jgi:ribonuclease Z
MSADRPVDNAPYLTHSHGGFTIEGYSRAAVQSYWRIPELNVGFDLGDSPWDFMGTDNWFITHTHLDHIAALPVYVARRRMMKMAPPNIYVPAEAVEDIGRLLRVMQKLDRGRQVANLVGLVPGQEVELNRQLYAKAYGTVTTDIPASEINDEDIEDGEPVEQFLATVNTAHTIPSRGYIVFERRHKLKPEFVGLPGNQIRDLRLSGTQVTAPVDTPLVAYTGDTSPEGLDHSDNAAFYEAKILITEMSFIRAQHRRDKIHKFGHMHLDDFVERADRFKNELIVAGHFSTRYHPTEVRRLLDAKLPAVLKPRMRLWI